MGNKKRNGIFLNNTSVTKEIALRTSLNQAQVKECVEVMFEIIKEITLQPKCNKRFEFQLGDIGKLTLRARAGRKAGTYIRPSGFKKGDPIVEVVEEEEPSYQFLSFAMFPTYKKTLKEISKKRSQEEVWEETLVDKNGEKKKVRHKGWKARDGKIVPLNKEEV